MRHQRSLRVGLLFVDRCGCGKSLVAIEINLGICQLRLVLRFLGDRLVELRLIDDRVDPRQHVAFLDVVAFLEVDAQQLAVDLRTYGYGVERFDRTHGVEIDRDIGTCDGGCKNGDRPLGGKATGAALLRTGATEDVVKRAKNSDQDERNRKRPAGASARFRQKLFRDLTVHRRLPRVSDANRRREPDRGSRLPGRGQASPAPAHLGQRRASAVFAAR